MPIEPAPLGDATTRPRWPSTRCHAHRALQSGRRARAMDRRRARSSLTGPRPARRQAPGDPASRTCSIASKLRRPREPRRAPQRDREGALVITRTFISLSMDGLGPHWVHLPFSSTRVAIPRRSPRELAVLDRAVMDELGPDPHEALGQEPRRRQHGQLFASGLCASESRVTAPIRFANTFGRALPTSMRPATSLPSPSPHDLPRVVVVPEARRSALITFSSSSSSRTTAWNRRGCENREVGARVRRRRVEGQAVWTRSGAGCCCGWRCAGHQERRAQDEHRDQHERTLSSRIRGAQAAVVESCAGFFDRPVDADRERSLAPSSYSSPIDKGPAWTFALEGPVGREHDQARDVGAKLTPLCSVAMAAVDRRETERVSIAPGRGCAYRRSSRCARLPHRRVGVGARRLDPVDPGAAARGGRNALDADPAAGGPHARVGPRR